ncbi:hypothetical protein PF005_g13939 [Phytophthora fragariae]|uniref:Uncharacterized protein n=1 Tax=Phytophthora fragariae TaxID=53985 RepID=A0A6A3SID7_9STRA|nr:hypothetical protein PF003_g12452 [Phytophthora fragariae]KAE8939019.1 hypothetical protein PF009_g11123 [Phytophthora fragariae]KAE9003700.1 hypothetical protein PF011_g12790 [Phytophthora fragariae]KAE9117247.1 hypothetical protein PF007_g9360 [Phytophthora fragariae]KAE9141769.1 hypothetical protein PF006_g13069 [Phytophthora fragariae]
MGLSVLSIANMDRDAVRKAYADIDAVRVANSILGAKT